MKYLIKNLEEMEKLALKIAHSLKGNELIAMKGNLGAGKTTLTKYIAKNLEVKEEVISPTFNIIKIYSSKLGPLYHVDAYRLENIGYDPVLDDYLFDNHALRFVEWYNFIDDNILFKDAIKIEINVVNDIREITIEGDLCIN